MTADRGSARAPWVLLSVVLALVLPSVAAAQGSPARAAEREITPPKPLSELTAVYPEQASGDTTVVLTLTVEADGSVSRVTADTASEPFASQAVKAAQAFRFQPAMRGGVAVRARIRIKIEFRAPVPELPDAPE